MTVLTARQPDAYSILAARGKNLDSILYGYKLATGSFARDLVLPEQLDYDEKRMSVWIDFANGNNRDGVGDVTEVTGIVTDRHRANPICLFDHGKKVDLPIGLSEDPETKSYTVEIDPIARIARGNIFVYQGKGLPDIERAKEFEHAIFCEQIFDLIVKRIIRGGSFGYTVIAAQPIQADYSTGTPQGLHLKATKLLEFGPTILPCSQDTVRKCLGENCCGKPLSPYLVKSLQPFAGQRKAQLGYEGKSTLGLGEPEKMSETNVPPSRWKPGVGAVKALSKPSEKDTRPEAFAQGVKDRQEKGKEAPNPYKDPFLRRAWTEGFTSNRSGQKSLKDLRSKYRKGHQQRTRRSSAGTSLIYVHRKDWDAMKQVCEGRGLKLERSGTDGDLDRVRLSGSDAVIDEVAKTFGRKKNKSLKGVGYHGPYVAVQIQGGTAWYVHEEGGKGGNISGPFPTKQEAEVEARQLEELMSKSMKTKAQFVEVPPGTGRERLSLSNETLANSPGGTEEIKTMKGKTKDLSTDETPADQANSQEVTSDLGNVQEGGEKIGAQVLRRLHQDHSILLEEYDGWLEALENDKVSSHLVQVLERLAECIEETESVWDKEYKDHGYEPLEGSKDLDGPQQPQEDQGEQNEAATEASEAPPEANQEAPTPEEAVDGMSGDAEDKKEEKSLKLFNAKRVKHLRTFYKNMKTGNGAVIQDGAEVWHHADGGRHIPGREAAKEKPGSTPESIAVAGETGKNLKGRKGKQLGIEGSHEPGKEAEKQEKQKDLGIEGSHEPGAEAIHQEQQKGLHDHHKPDVQEAHDYLGELGQTQTYGDEHRMKSYHFHKSLGGIATHLAKDFPELEGMDDTSNIQGPTGEREVRTNGAAQTKTAGTKCPECGTTMTIAPGTALYQDRNICPKCGYPVHVENKKDFPAVDKQNNAVDITKPGSPTEVHPGKEPAQQFGAAADSPESPKGTGYGDIGKTKEFPEADQIDDTSEVSRVKEFHSALKNASGFFGQMAGERAFGDAHRQKAGYCQKMLAGVLEQGFPQVDQQTNVAEVTEPLGDVSVKSLTDLLALRQKSINDMNAKLELMFSKS